MPSFLWRTVSGGVCICECVYLGVCTWVCAREGGMRGVRWGDLARLVCVCARVSTSVHVSVCMESSVLPSPNTLGCVFV